MAAGRTVPADRAVHSLHSYFLRPGDPKAEIRYAVDRIRDGRSFTTRRVVAWQERKGEDVAIFALTADFHAGETAIAEHSLPMPDVHGPESLPGIGGDRRPARRARGLDERHGPGRRAALPAGPVRGAAEVTAGHEDVDLVPGRRANWATTPSCTPRR